MPDGSQSNVPFNLPEAKDEWDYIWQRPHQNARDRSISFSHQSSSHHAHSGRTSPVKDGGGFTGTMDDGADDPPLKDSFDDFLGYESEFLANILSPQPALCHQKFELVVDDLCFIGHPVCAESDGVWRFKSEKRDYSRGRGSRKRTMSSEDLSGSTELGRNTSPVPETSNAKSSWLHSFHLVLVHDLPDPSSSASGNISKYFDVIYEQIAFTVTAVLFQEQVLANFVESECEVLGRLKDDCAARGEPFEQFITEAILNCSIAPAMRTLYECIKSRSLAQLTIHNLTLELQLPPYIDSLLHSVDDTDADLNYLGTESSHGISLDSSMSGITGRGSGGGWGKELSFAWRLPSLDPWKSLLLLDGSEGKDWMEVYASLKSGAVKEEDRVLGEQLVRFLEMADVTLSFVDMASLLDWNLESQVFPIVRWLVHHRRAKVVDIVHRGLKTVFTVSPKFEAPVRQLSSEFRTAFPDSSIPPLPSLLSTVSSAQSKHFYAAVVRSKERIPQYLSVVQWMLKKDLLVTLHLRIRVVVPSELKARVRKEWGRKRAGAKRRREIRRKLGTYISFEDEKSNKYSAFTGRGRRRKPVLLDDEEDKKETDEMSTLGDELFEESQSPPWLSLSPKSIRQSTRRGSSGLDPRPILADLTEPPIAEETGDLELDNEDEDEEVDVEESEPGRGEDFDLEIGEIEFETKEGEKDDSVSSIIVDPGRATYKERQWLEAMLEGKDSVVARRFQQINRYFDGKCTDDEILFRAEITRKQLREVLHHFEEYVQTTLHPS